MKKAPRAKNVEAYIAAAPPKTRGILKQLRKTIKEAAPNVNEGISYGMPYYNYYGRIAYFAAFKEWCSFFWISADNRKTYKKEFASQLVVGKTLRLPLGKKVPTALIKKLVKARAKENEARKTKKK